MGVGVVGSRELQRGQPTIGLDEALATIPGVFVGNRFNLALDQRVAIRGFGSRANFGVRGVVVLLDGIPQTLADGQSQLTNVEIGALSRAEALRGSASSLYGNGAGGVLAFTTDMRAPSARRLGARGGRIGRAAQVAGSAAGRSGRAAGVLNLSRMTWDGFRPHNEAEVRQLNAGVDYALDPNTVAQLRLNLSDVPWRSIPRAHRPGVRGRPRSGGAQQHPARRGQGGAPEPTLAPGQSRAGGRLAMGRQRVRTHARPAQRHRRGAAGPVRAGGGHVHPDRPGRRRRARGRRPSARRNPGADTHRRRAVAVDARRPPDFRDTGGRPTTPTDTLLLDQRETVWSVGPFAQLGWSPTARLLLSAGARHDRVHFAADDRYLSDGNDGGSRTLPAWSGHAGASWLVADALVPYVNVSTSFETPTTVELQGRADGGGGFSDELGPQRAITTELGARGTMLDGRITYSAAAFRTRVRDAIVQYAKVSGRAYYRNAGRTANDGIELGLDLQPVPWLGVNAAYTWAHYRFEDYRIVDGTTTTVLDGNVIPGVPEHFLRVGLRTRPLPSLTVDADQTVSSSVFADDANTLRVEGWGAGITRLRAAWDGRVAGVALQPFAGVENLFAHRYVSTVVVNGFGGRVREPGPGRTWYVGVAVGR